MIAYDVLCTICGRPYDGSKSWTALMVPLLPNPVVTRAACPQCMARLYPGIAASIESVRRTTVCHDQHVEQIIGNSWTGL